MGPEFQDLVASIFADSHYFPVFSLWIRFPGLETGSHETAPTAIQSRVAEISPSYLATAQLFRLLT
jgi:hypothetical protein